MGKKNYICQFLARYDEFIVIFSSTIKSDESQFLTMEDLNKIINDIDTKVSHYLYSNSRGK